MAEQLHISTHAGKRERYAELVPQIEALVSGESDLVANLSNIAAALRQAMHFFWVGFYVVKGEQLVLGPFQGPIACTRIDYGKGVCGTCWKEGRVMVVPDVEKFPGHIACSSDSRSEIVLPVMKHGKVVMVLDVDSDRLNDFDDVDQEALTRLTRIIERLL